MFSGKVRVFHEMRLPEDAIPVGYAAIIDAYQLPVPFPIKLSAIGQRHKVYESEGWSLYTPRHKPEASLEGHLFFALKYEGIDLAVLKKLFLTVPSTDIEHIIRQKPTSTYGRRIWFLYEWLLGINLDLADANIVSYVDVIDTTQQWGVKGVTSPRHRVRNNLPGVRDFCPLVFRTKAINSYVNANFTQEAQRVVGDTSADILARTAAFLLLKDSKSSYAIEGESGPQNRIQRWGKVIGEAGKYPLDIDELVRLQKIVIGDSRFVKLGLRAEGGFIGEHDRITRLPLPVHISARHEDLNSLLQGMIAFDHHFSLELDPVIISAVVAFSFVYIHPFEDGNGRIHRYLIHHVLAQNGFNPKGVVFPISAAILEKMDEYREVLESYSKRVLPFIEWEPTAQMNVRVLNDTADYYRYFDATPHVEFLYTCIEKTIRIDLPQEIDFLKKYDLFKQRIETLVDMPSSQIDLLFHFLKQNDGILSRRGRDKEFSVLQQSEIDYVEGVYADIFLQMDSLP